MHIRSPPRSFLKNKIKLKYKIKNNNSGRSLPSLPPTPPPSSERQRRDPPGTHHWPRWALPGAAGGEDCGGRCCCQTLRPDPLLVAGHQAGGPPPLPTPLALFTLSPSLSHTPTLYFSPLGVFLLFLSFFFLWKKNMNRFCLFVCLFPRCGYFDISTSADRF